MLSGLYSECDIISFGPMITGAHSPNEQVNIASVSTFWDYLQALLHKLQQ